MRRVVASGEKGQIHNVEKKLVMSLDDLIINESNGAQKNGNIAAGAKEATLLRDFKTSTVLKRNQSAPGHDVPSSKAAAAYGPQRVLRVAARAQPYVKQGAMFTRFLYVRDVIGFGFRTRFRSPLKYSFILD